MRLTIASAAAVVLLLLVTASNASAQTSQVDAYVLGGPGLFAGDSLNFGAAGAEFIGQSGVGVGIERGYYWGIGPYIYDKRSHTNRTLDLHVVITKPRNDHVRFAPFFVGGVSVFSNPQDDSYLGFVIGLGSNIWMTRHVAMRLDGRIPFFATSGGGGTAGIGVTLR
jgi:hypothetical protein